MFGQKAPDAKAVGELGVSGVGRKGSLWADCGEEVL